MATFDPEEINPYQAPAATIGGQPMFEANTDAEAIRRAYIGHEASIKSIGLLCYLGVAFCLMAVVGLVFAAVAATRAPQDAPGMNATLAFGIGGVVYLGLAALNGAMGHGLRNLKPWARWTTVVVMGLTVLLNVVQAVGTLVVQPAVAPFVLIGSIIPGYILYLVASSKGAMVFSSEYRDIVRQTPHIKYKTSLLVKVLLGVLVAFILFALGVVLFGGVSGR